MIIKTEFEFSSKELIELGASFVSFLRRVKEEEKQKRTKAKWVAEESTKDKRFYCSYCGHVATTEKEMSRYCPDCGKLMDNFYSEL